MSRDSYNTNSKKLILDKVKKITEDFSCKDIKDKLDSDGCVISITTIYRILNSYVEAGILKRFYNDNNTARYQYISECCHSNHFFLKCVTCGKIVHVDCDCINDFSNHISLEHNFKILNNNIFIAGYCNSCVKGDIL